MLPPAEMVASGRGGLVGRGGRGRAERCRVRARGRSVVGERVRARAGRVAPGLAGLLREEAA
jgi:hypothetical protein